VQHLVPATLVVLVKTGGLCHQRWKCDVLGHWPAL
jgi:hypothetical protein